LKKATKKDKVLLLGCKGAGKTTLYLRVRPSLLLKAPSNLIGMQMVHQLFNKKTTTSIDVNESSYQVDDDTTVRLVDVPGHPRLAE
jgi:signal recognition particle receptor subunit beta